MVTTMKAGPRNDAHYWRSALIPGADMVTARFTDHAYSPHWHEAYTISLIEGGAERYDYRGKRHVADAGSLPIINPGEIHTGSSAADAGWQCRTFYLPTGFVRQVVDEAGLAGTEPPWFGSDIIRDPDLAARALRAHRSWKPAPTGWPPNPCCSTRSRRCWCGTRRRGPLHGRSGRTEPGWRA